MIQTTQPTVASMTSARKRQNHSPTYCLGAEGGAVVSSAAAMAFGVFAPCVGPVYHRSGFSSRILELTHAERAGFRCLRDAVRRAFRTGALRAILARQGRARVAGLAQQAARIHLAAQPDGPLPAVF